MSDVLEKTDLKVTNDGDHDKFQHYFAKKDIEANLMTGKPMKALCGKVVAQQSDPHGRTVCPTCKDIFENVMKD
jgi:Protein of unknown function (DUF3039)